jgi:hypothetical protein
LLRLIAVAQRGPTINAMALKNVLGQIEPNDRDRRQIDDRLSHGRRSQSLDQRPFTFSMAESPTG